MKKVGIITINDNDNYGNRLQNYAVQQVLKKLDCDVETIRNEKECKAKNLLRRTVKGIRNQIKKLKNIKRYRFFMDFNKNIIFSKNKITPTKIPINFDKEYDYFIVGSDQVWNPNFGRFNKLDLLDFTEDNKKIAFSASFGVAELPDKVKEYGKKNLKKFKAISVREDKGKEIVKDIAGREDVQVLIDPTMLLDIAEWDKVTKKPKQLKYEKYILNYFLGEISDERKKEILKIAKENNCEVINILDKKEKYYQTGPSEFLYLEKNAFLICTDSFHSCVFAILYNKPFIVFNREDREEKMNSRIETLLSKFKLKDRGFCGKITEENLKHDYSEGYEILEKEKEKSIKFLKNAIE